MNLRLIILVATLIIGQFSCAHVRPQEVSFSRLSQDERSYTINSGLERAQELIIRDQTSWEQAWAQIHSIRRPVPPLPDVDFQSNVVVVVALGQMRSGGVDIAVTAAVRERTGVLVSVSEKQPGSNCVVTMNLTSPVDIAVLPRTAEPITFQRLVTTDSC
jgi:hypothetical protein